MGRLTTGTQQKKLRKIMIFGFTRCCDTRWHPNPLPTISPLANANERRAGNPTLSTEDGGLGPALVMIDRIHNTPHRPVQWVGILKHSSTFPQHVASTHGTRFMGGNFNHHSIGGKKGANVWIKLPPRWLNGCWIFMQKKHGRSCVWHSFHQTGLYWLEGLGQKMPNGQRCAKI